MDVDAVVSEVRAQVAELADEDMPVSAMCLYHAVLAVEAIRARGVRAILQAGTATWKMLSPDLDDGTVENAFGYLWDPAEAVPLARRGLMPEMHVWAATVAPMAVVDLASCYFPAQAQRLKGIAWRAAPPPDYVWGTPPAGCRYEPHREAVACAVAMAARVFGERRALRAVM